MDHNDSMKDTIRDQFITESINSEEVYYLLKYGSANNWIDDLEGNYRVPFWLNKKSAEEFAENHSDELKLGKSSLFDFLYFWLPDMYNKLTTISIMQGSDSFGFSADEIQMRYDDLMPEALQTAYEEKKASHPEYSYVCIGSFPNSDARNLLKEFDKEGIRYNDGVDSSRIQGMDIVQATLGGGTCGYGAGVFITVHEDDLKKVDDIQKRVFSPEI